MKILFKRQRKIIANCSNLKYWLINNSGVVFRTLTLGIQETTFVFIASDRN